MSKSYSADDGEIGDVIAKVMKSEYRSLHDAGVTVEAFTAANDTGPAVVLHGWPCSAIIRIKNLEDRTAGSADARMIVDRADWEGRSAAERRALVAGQLQRLTILRDKETGDPKLDDVGRPRLRMVKPDWSVSGFDTIAERYGADAPEVQVAAKIKARLEQLEINWDDASLRGETGTVPMQEAAA